MLVIEQIPSAKLVVDAYWGMLNPGSRRSVVHAVRLDGSSAVTVDSMENLMANQNAGAALAVCERCGATGHDAIDCEKAKEKDKEKPI